jgi:GDP-L-fucose synthase
MNNKTIYVAGHNGMVGSALVRKLKDEGFNNILTQSSKQLDLRQQADVERFFEENKNNS